ncbi:glycoside hydrolase family 15 protein [Rhodococcus rhodochrous]|uniref:glycoside hydrolase family 15 protein n=1 Tax=Rhodococcus rhodochrous TaxID=1829 RepID=UPI000D06522E|nr:glycoside hydrolase family 15 protein [Rhodococcus rhodochrous]AYA25339.1 glycoside hydrolase family 15 protein [Rhodococcus rhodochrous]
MLLEDYGFIGDLQTSALVGRNGSIDWLCMPAFDSGSCFASLLGGPEHGRWLVAPTAEPVAVTRRYVEGTLVLETEFETAEGAVRLIDFMPRRGSGPPRLIRIVEGLRGRVPMRMHLLVRPDYASVTPWVEAVADGAVATAGPDAFHLCTTVPLEIRAGTVDSEFVAVESGRYRFALDRYASFEPAPVVEDAESALARTVEWWRDWTGRCTYKGAYRDEVLRSLIVLKGMTDETTGAIVAAPTTSLPEALGGVRNWDYRYCWLRDSVLALEALLAGGYTGEALAFRDFLLRAGTGDPADVQIMYGIRGERRLTEFEVDHLPGYEGSAPVRVGNAAAEQFQLDVYGEVLSVAYKGAEALGRIEVRMWPRWQAVIEHVEKIWRDPDDGIWETRGPRRDFTQSKVMAWVVFDRAVRIAEGFGLDAPLERWKRTRDEIHHEICERGYDPVRGTFTQYYGSTELDASVLLIPLVGFLPPTDDRVTSTIDAIRSELGRDGFVSRYSTTDTDDGLPGDEGQFLACSFWLVSALALNGRVDEARALFERLLGLANDLGLLAEEYDVQAGRQVGNFPQAFSHLTLVGAAFAITVAERAQAADPVDGAPGV